MSIWATRGRSERPTYQKLLAVQIKLNETKFKIRVKKVQLCQKKLCLQMLLLKAGRTFDTTEEDEDYIPITRDDIDDLELDLEDLQLLQQVEEHAYEIAQWEDQVAARRQQRQWNSTNRNEYRKATRARLAKEKQGH